VKTLVLANQKGGVGKSAIACQLAYFVAELRQKRVLFIDLDHQGNSTKALDTSGLVTLAQSNCVFRRKQPLISVQPRHQF